VFTSSAPSKSAASGRDFLLLALSGEAGLLLVAWGLGSWLQVSPFSRLHPTLPALVWGVAGSLPLLLGLGWMVTTERPAVRRLVELVAEGLAPQLARGSLLVLAALALVAGLSEEALFRGVIQEALQQRVSPAVALVLTSLVFGLVHFASSTYVLFAAAMGFYLGSLFLLTENLLAPIVAHSVYDLAALIWVARQAPPVQT